jgi:hypothetical protein
MIYSKKVILRYYLLLAFSFLLNSGYSGIVYNNIESQVDDEIYKATYHFQFRVADSLIKANDSYLNDNLKYNLAVVNYYWWRLISGEQNTEFADLVSNRIEKIRTSYRLNESGKDTEQLFLLISVYAYSARVSLLDYSYYTALNDLSRYYSWIKMSFGREGSYKPFYLTSGLYYFFVGYAKEKMPFLSPLLYFYTPGNKGIGLQYIKAAESSGDWKINQEAKYFLMKINFDIYRNYIEAAKYCNQLMAAYPENLLFQLYMFRISLALGQVPYAKARMAIMERTAYNNHQLTADEQEFYVRQAKLGLEAFSKQKK